MCGETLAAETLGNQEGNYATTCHRVFVAGFAAGACNRDPDTDGGTPAETGQPGTRLSPRPGPAIGARSHAARSGGAQDRRARGHHSGGHRAARRPRYERRRRTPATSKQPVRAHLSRAVLVDGQPVLAEGSTRQRRRDRRDAGRRRSKDARTSAVRFDSRDAGAAATSGTGSRPPPSVGRPPATKKDDAIKIGAPAAGGAIIGAIVGGGKGAAIGAAAGGGAGTAVVLSTRGKEIRAAGRQRPARAPDRAAHDQNQRLGLGTRG